MNAVYTRYSWVIIAALIFFWASYSSQAQTPQELAQQLVGEWEGEQDGEKLVIFFKANGNFELLQGDERVKGAYVVDFSKDPAHITLKTSGDDPGRSILEFLSANKIRLEEGRTDGTRPTRFKNFNILERQ